MNKLKTIFCHLNYNWHKRLSKHKCIEVEAYSGLVGFSNKLHIAVGSREVSLVLSILYALFQFEVSVRWKTDHAGISVWLGLLGFSVEAHFYDTRHWDFNNNCWEYYDD